MYATSQTNLRTCGCRDIVGVAHVVGLVVVMTDDLSYKYRQGSDFWYLTGFQEPDSAVIIGTYNFFWIFFII